jgi:hypothetical protein
MNTPVRRPDGAKAVPKRYMRSVLTLHGEARIDVDRASTTLSVCERPSGISRSADGVEPDDVWIRGAR